MLPLPLPLLWAARVDKWSTPLPRPQPGIPRRAPLSLPWPCLGTTGQFSTLREIAHPSRYLEGFGVSFSLTRRSSWPPLCHPSVRVCSLTHCCSATLAERTASLSAGRQTPQQSTALHIHDNNWLDWPMDFTDIFRCTTILGTHRSEQVAISASALLNLLLLFISTSFLPCLSLWAVTSRHVWQVSGCLHLPHLADIDLQVWHLIARVVTDTLKNKNLNPGHNYTFHFG